MVGQAVRDGRLIPQPCEKCGASPTHAHHDDYSKPLDVRWLCPVHHAEHHHAAIDSPEIVAALGFSLTQDEAPVPG